jgi:hypothetical protein
VTTNKTKYLREIAYAELGKQFLEFEGNDLYEKNIKWSRKKGRKIFGLDKILMKLIDQIQFIIALWLMTIARAEENQEFYDFLNALSSSLMDDLYGNS